MLNLKNQIILELSFTKNIFKFTLKKMDSLIIVPSNKHANKKPLNPHIYTTQTHPKVIFKSHQYIYNRTNKNSVYYACFHRLIRNCSASLSLNKELTELQKEGISKSGLTKFFLILNRK
jgi:hypothetical protein